MPRSRNQDLYPEENEAKLTHEDTLTTFKSYVLEARRLQQKYASEITLIIGMETELIHNTTITEIKTLRNELQLDYLVGSLHHVNEIPIDFNEEMYQTAETVAYEKCIDKSISPTEALFQQYFDSQYELLTLLKPEVIGHFDLIRIFRPKFDISDVVWEKIRRNVDVIVGYGGVVEINSSGWRKGLVYDLEKRQIHIIR
ncbi:histidinolphosphatase [Blyttiomyces sp. JEL0837]|nr:histidinolphosphatase [Blyttiomyces sp. JEL0837]